MLDRDIKNDRLYSKLSVNDMVRVKVKKTITSKSWDLKWSEDLFKVITSLKKCFKSSNCINASHIEVASSGSVNPLESPTAIQFSTQTFSYLPASKLSSLIALISCLKYVEASLIA